jgi:hypothetical protein
MSYTINSPLLVNTVQNGIVVPRLSSYQKSIIPSISQGTIIYDNTLNDFQFYNGSNWISTGQSATGANYNTAGVDAFGRLRVSNPFTLFDSSFRYKDNDKFSTSISGAATGYINSSTSTYEMSITGPNQHVYRESKNVFSYQPGKSLQVLCTHVCATGSYSATGMLQRVGYFSSLNGIFLQVNEGVVGFGIRNNGVDTIVNQTEWNTDQLNGSGPSGVVLDITKAQIFYTDIEWLGVGTVNVGFIINSAFLTCHKFYHANFFTSTYMTTATLPIRYEIASSGSYITSPIQTLQQICSTVISEGGYQALSMQNVFDLGTNVAANNVTNVNFSPLISIRLNPNRLDSVVLPDEVNLFLTSSGNIQYKLILNGSMTNTGTFAPFNLTISNVDVMTGSSATTITGGKVIDTSFISSSNQVKSSFNQSGIEAFNYQLGRTIDGVSDVLSVCAKSFTGNQTVTASLQWLELN